MKRILKQGEKRKPEILDGVVHYRCVSCLELLPVDRYYTYKKSSSGIYSRCKKCHQTGGSSINVKLANEITKEKLAEIIEEFYRLNGLENIKREVTFSYSGTTIYLNGEKIAEFIQGEWKVMQFCGYGYEPAERIQRSKWHKMWEGGVNIFEERGLFLSVDAAWKKFASDRHLVEYKLNKWVKWEDNGKRRRMWNNSQDCSKTA